MVDAHEEPRVLAMKLFSISCGFEWAVAIVYGPNYDSARAPFWDNLSMVLSLWFVPRCLGGDFSMVRFPREKKGGVILSRSMERFSDFIIGNALVDLPLVGRKFTWSDNRER